MPKHLTESVDGSITSTLTFTTGICAVSPGGTFKADSISEYTTGSGITIDSVLLKDDGIGALYTLHPTSGITLMKVCTDFGADIAAGVTNLAIHDKLAVSTSISTAATQYMYFYGDGMLVPAAGITVTAYSPANIVAPSHKQIVDSSAAGAGLRFSKNGDIYVGWWGAKGDCDASTGTGTDDTTTIQLAIDSARALYSTTTTDGPTLHFEPSKVYLTTRSLWAGRNATTSSKWLQAIDGHGAYLYGKHSGHILDYTGAHGKNIDNLNFIGHSGTTPYSGLFLSRKDATGGGATNINNCEWKGEYTVAAVINYQSEVFDLSNSSIYMDNGIAAIIFTGDGYYYNASGTTVQLSAPKVDSWPGEVTNIKHQIKNCNIQHKTPNSAMYSAHIQASKVAQFSVKDCNITNTTAAEPDAVYIQFYGSNTGVQIEKNLFHSVRGRDVEINGTITQFSFKENELGSAICETYFTYTSGVTEPSYGDTVRGATSLATGRVVYVETPTGGSWAGDDAAGVIYIDRETGTFVAENIDNVTSGETSVFSIASGTTEHGANIYGVGDGTTSGSGTLYHAEIVADTLDFHESACQIIGNNILRIGSTASYGALKVYSRLDGDVFLRNNVVFEKNTSDALANARVHWADLGFSYGLSAYRETTVASGTSVQPNLMTITIPAGYLKIGGDIRIIGGGNVIGDTGTTVVLNFSDQAGSGVTSYTMVSGVTLPTASTWQFDVTLLYSSAKVQEGFGDFMVSQTESSTTPYTTWANGYITPGLDFDTGVTIYLTAPISTGNVRQQTMRIIGLY